jgi:hypothetical protein
VAVDLPSDAVPLSMAGANALPDGSAAGALVKVCLRVYLSFSGERATERGLECCSNKLQMIKLRMQY